MSSLFFLLVNIFIIAANAQKIDPTELKCLVCQKTLDEVQQQVANIDPTLQVDAGSYRLDADGNIKKKTVSKAFSEVHLSELLESVCDKMDDYVRAHWKSSGTLTLLKLIDSNGQMSPDMMNVDLVQDGDLNKSLKYYCEMLVEEHEDAIIKNLTEGAEDIDVQVCTIAAEYCDPQNMKLPNDEL